MNVLHIVDDHGFIVVEPKEFLAHPVNRYREIVVDDPDDPYGPPIYEGPAFMAAKYLTLGAFWYEFKDDDVYSD